MPDSPQADLKAIETSAKKILEPKGAKSITIEEKDVAFGLKAIMLKFAWPEENGTDFIEEQLGKIANVSSVTIEDYRRAFG
jgi:translation elongation factor aEF-1 beta